MSIDLSVVIINYNGEHYIKDCLNSVFDQKTNFRFDCFVVDNNSQDHSVDILKTYHDKIHLIVNSKNVGFSKANNQCFPLCKGRHTLLLNNDTIVHDNVFDTIIHYMDSNPKVGALSPKLLNPNGSLQNQGSFLNAWRFKSDTPIKVPFICGAAMFTRTSLLLEIGGLDDNLFFYNDDIDYCKAVQKKGSEIHYLPLVMVTHLGGLSTQTRKAGSIIDGYRGSAYLCKKFYPLPIYYLYRVLVMLDLIPRLIIYATLTLFKKEYKDALFAYFTVTQNMICGKILPEREGEKNDINQSDP